MQIADPTQTRAYFFGNLYISPIQHGIQAAHVVTKLFAKYGRQYASNEGDDLYDWADQGVTKILLNGGYQSNLQDIYRILEIICPPLELPFEQFHESVEALNGALTSVGVLVPAEVYGMRIDDSVYLRYYGLNIGDTQELPVPAAYHARTAVQDLASTPADILALLTRNVESYETLDFQITLAMTLRTARLA